MAKSNSETGHYKNVANADKLFTLTSALLKYNPGRSALQTPALIDQHVAAKKIMEDLSAAEVAEAIATKARLVPFRELPALATRVVNELESAVPDAAVLPMATNLLHKIRGARVGKINDDKAETPAGITTAPEEENSNDSGGSHSVSQRSFDALLDHFDKLIDVLEAEPAYLSYQPDLTIQALHDHLDAMSDLNRKALKAIINTNGFRDKRFVALYAPVSGLVPTAKAVKMAILGAYNASSPEYKQAAAIQLRMLPRK